MRLEPLIKVWKVSSGPLIVNPNGNKPNALATFFIAGLYCLYQKPSISYVSWPEKFLSKTPFSYLLMILDLSSVFMGKKYNAKQGGAARCVKSLSALLCADLCF